MIGYISIVVLILFKVHFWNVELLKDTLIWTATAAFVVFININKVNNDENYIKEIVLENFKLTIIVEFISNIYVFSLLTEIILFPIVLFLIILLAVSKLEDKNQVVTKLINLILTLAGLILIAYVINKICFNFQDFPLIENLKEFILPVILTLCYIPFVYFLALFVIYQTFFIQINMAFRNKKLLSKYAKYEILKKCNINLSMLRKTSKELKVFMIENRRELDDAILTITS